MLNRRTPLRSKPRTPWVKPERQAVLHHAPAGLAARVRTGPAELAAVPKRGAGTSHEGYRRLVAALPCFHCGVHGLSQAAHPNTGKSMGKKLLDDRLCFPLCADTVGRRGCHPQFDQGGMFSQALRREIEPQWGRMARATIVALSQWPASLPRWDESKPTAAALAKAAALAAVVLAVAAGPAQAATCAWPDPGADRYRGDPAAAVMRLSEIPTDERLQLADMVRQGYGWRRVMVSRDAVDGGRLSDLRSMNFGAGRVCQGEVDRSMWTAGRNEAARGYSLGRWSVLHFESCNNVALATDTLALPAPAAPTRAGLRQAQGGGMPAWAQAVPAGTNQIPEPPALALLALAALIGVITRKRK